jgi:hypothetical protein
MATGGAMEKYQIRITSKPGDALKPDVILSCDYAAVRYGQRMAEPGEKVEVWRSGECIFLSEDLGCRRIPKELKQAAQ